MTENDSKDLSIISNISMCLGISSLIAYLLLSTELIANSVTLSFYGLILSFVLGIISNILGIVLIIMNRFQCKSVFVKALVGILASVFTIFLFAQSIWITLSL